MQFLNVNIFDKISSFFEKNLKINIRASKWDKDKELFDNFQLMCFNKGYGLEEYTVTTEDNYKLQLFRLVNKKLDYNSHKQAVIFQHGLLDSSDAWICNYEKNCLPFILCKKGFDVWVANSRGNKYSKYVEIEEGNRNPSKEKEYWDYSFHEMGLYDIPAIIDKILNLNKTTQKIIYFGHSQGGASILSGMTQKLEYYKQRLRSVVLLAPASRVDNYDSTFLSFLKDLKLEEKLKERNIYEVMPYDPSFNDIKVKISNLYPTLHYAMLELTSDEVSWMNCPERIKCYLAHYPCGTSLKSLLHFKQLIDNKNFQSFDHGEEENMKRYNSPYAIDYDLSKIEGIPIILCGGLNDKLTHINDIRWLKSKIERTIFSYYEFDHMGHVSFLINNDITWFNFVLRDIYKILDRENIISHTAPHAEIVRKETVWLGDNLEMERETQEVNVFEEEIQIERDYNLIPVHLTPVENVNENENVVVDYDDTPGNEIPTTKISKRIVNNHSLNTSEIFEDEVEYVDNVTYQTIIHRNKSVITNNTLVTNYEVHEEFEESNTYQNQTVQILNRKAPSSNLIEESQAVPEHHDNTIDVPTHDENDYVSDQNKNIAFVTTDVNNLNESLVVNKLELKTEELDKEDSANELKLLNSYNNEDAHDIENVQSNNEINFLNKQSNDEEIVQSNNESILIIKNDEPIQSGIIENDNPELSAKINKENESKLKNTEIETKINEEKNTKILSNIKIQNNKNVIETEADYDIYNKMDLMQSKMKKYSSNTEKEKLNVYNDKNDFYLKSQKKNTILSEKEITIKNLKNSKNITTNQNMARLSELDNVESQRLKSRSPNKRLFDNGGFEGKLKKLSVTNSTAAKSSYKNKEVLKFRIDSIEQNKEIFIRTQNSENLIGGVAKFNLN